MPATREQILASLCKAYNMEIETIANYLAASHNLDGVRADFVKQALAADIPGELTHATQLSNRIKQLDGTVPGSMSLKMTQKSLQPAPDTTDVVASSAASSTPRRRPQGADHGKDVQKRFWPSITPAAP